MIAVDWSERLLGAPSIVGGATEDAFRSAYAVLEDEIMVGEFPCIDDAFVKASSLVEVIDAPPPSRARQAHFAIDGTRRPLDRLVLSSYVEPME